MPRPILTRRNALRASLGAGCMMAGAVGAAWTFQRDILYDRDTAASPPRLPGLAIETPTLTTADGERLTAWYLPPAGDQPVFLYLGGRIGGLAVQRGRWRRIAARRAGFLAINYRGYGGSTGSPSEHGLQLDAKAAHEWLARRYPIDRIVIHGFSLGSGVGVRLAAEHPSRALILEAPFLGLEDMAAVRCPWLPLGWLLRDRYPSRDWIGRVRMPVLIVHGDADTVIPFESGERLFRLANAPKVFVRMSGSDHNTLTRDGLYDHIWRFLGEPAGVASQAP